MQLKLAPFPTQPPPWNEGVPHPRDPLRVVGSRTGLLRTPINQGLKSPDSGRNHRYLGCHQQTQQARQDCRGSGPSRRPGEESPSQHRLPRVRHPEAGGAGENREPPTRTECCQETETGKATNNTHLATLLDMCTEGSSGAGHAEAGASAEPSALDIPGQALLPAGPAVAATLPTVSKRQAKAIKPTEPPDQPRSPNTREGSLLNWFSTLQSPLLRPC